MYCVFAFRVLVCVLLDSSHWMISRDEWISSSCAESTHTHTTSLTHGKLLSLLDVSLFSATLLHLSLKTCVYLN